MARDTSQFVKGCSVCAILKTPRVDFITDLPRSDSYTCVLVVVDRFSKACKLIPLPGLPTAMQTAESLFHHLFRNFGLPEDIVSDRGPQYTSRVWQAFFNLLEGLRKSHIRVSSTVQWPDRAEDPGHWVVSLEFLPPEPTRLEPFPSMGRVSTEFTPSTLHWSHPLPVRTRIPTLLVPLGRAIIRSSSGGLLVQRG